jgi:hypothetical protein
MDCSAVYRMRTQKEERNFGKGKEKLFSSGIFKLLCILKTQEDTWTELK